MTLAANGYVLRVPSDRVQALLDGIDKGQSISQPVPEFDYSRSTTMLVLLSFRNDEITHVGDGVKGRGGGTQQDLLRISNVEKLPRTVTFDTLAQKAPSAVRHHLQERLQMGGALAPKSLGATVDALLEIEPRIAQRIARYSERRQAFVSSLSERSRENLALQKESLNAVLRIAGMDPDVAINWLPPREGQIGNYLTGVQKPPVREDLMVVADAEGIPGFELVEKDIQTATKIFTKGTTRLRVTMANRQPLEKQTGADLIYFNETYSAFVMVQYKAMRDQLRRGTSFTHI
jgi:hypothetical protein